MLTKDQINAYLSRIGFEGEPVINKDTLDELVLRHQMAVPFETVTLCRSGNAPALGIDELYAKIVERNGGGYCFELNKIFGELLESLGFKTRPVLSRAVRGREGRMPINHRGIIVELEDGLYSVDVGFGGPMPAGALKLEEGVEQVIDEETFYARRLSDSWWAIERITRANFDTYDDEVPERRQIELELCTSEAEEQDFDMLNVFFSLPGTLFHDHELVNLRTKGGYLGYKDGLLTVRQDGVKTVTELPDKAAIDSALAETFGMQM